MRTMKWLVIVVSAAIPIWTLAGPGEDLGFRMDTEIVEGNADDDICPGTTLLQNDNDFFPNGYCWRFGGVVLMVA